MCLAVPLLVERIVDDHTAVVAQGEFRLTVDTSMVERAAPGDFLIVHAGFAIEKLDERSASETLELFDEMRAAGEDAT
ncbi:HypC/HybG/HupF family hydrogenase formation chaperone [Salinispira pacifica]